MRSKNNKPQWTLLIAGIFASTVSADDMLASFNGGGFELPEFDEFSVPVVLTASRIQQHQADVPASVTILDADLIKHLGVKNLAEVFHYVPGMMMAADRNNNADGVHYHGGPAALPKNLQVLLNGRSMYRTGLASVSWYEMPVAIEEIRRIEVVRGPNSATYGANAYQAVINILTKHPADTYGSSVSITTGNNGENNTYLKHGGEFAGMDYRVSYTQKSTDHFKDYVDTDPSGECADGCGDDREARFIDVEAYKSLPGLGELDFSITALQAERGIGNPAEFQSNDNQATEGRYELGLTFTKDLSSKHQIQIRSSVSQYNQRQAIEVEDVATVLLNNNLKDLFELNPEATDGLSTEASNFDRVEADYKETGDATKFLSYWNGIDVTINSSDISGLTAQTKNDLGLIRSYKVAQLLSDNSVVTDYISSLTLEEQALANAVLVMPNIGGSASGVVNADLDEYRFDVEIQDTYVFSPQLTLVSGLSFRHDKVESQHYFAGEKSNDTSRIFASATWAPVDSISAHLGVMGEKEDRTELVFAPRAALNYKFTPSQSMRLVYSESVRSPDLFEQSANWNFVVEGYEGASGNTYYQTQQGPETLDHQYIKSYEIGYYGRLQTLDSEVDVRVFKEDLTDIVYQSIKISDLKTIQGTSISFEGIEWQLSSQPFDETTFRLVGAHVEADLDVAPGFTTDDVKSTTLLRVYAQDSLTFSWFQSWPASVNSSLSYVSAHKYDQTNNDVADRTVLERIEANLFKSLQLAGNEVELNLSAQHDLSSDPYIRNENVYEDDTRVQLGLRLNF